jgi:hypothetical protein
MAGMDYWGRPLDKAYQLIDPPGPGDSPFPFESSAPPHMLGDDSEWLSASGAIEEFSDPGLIEGRDNSLSQLRDAKKMHADTQDLIREITSRYLNGGRWIQGDLDAMNKLVAENGERYKLVEKCAHDFACDMRELASELVEKLEGGALIAKGFRVPHEHGNALIDPIPTNEWKIMWLEWEKSRAFRFDSDEMLYTGIEIRKAT